MLGDPAASTASERAFSVAGHKMEERERRCQAASWCCWWIAVYSWTETL